MALKIGILGIGNAGSQVANLGKQNGFEAYIVNVSKDDVSMTSGVDNAIIGNEMGSGKNRDLAKKYGKAAIKDLIQLEQFSAFINSCQIVFVTYSLAGGTGAALGPMMTAVLKASFRNADDSKRIRFVNLGIAPAIFESLQGQENMIATLKELQSYESCYGLYDNNNYADYPVQEMMLRINKQIIEDLKVIRGDYNLLSQYNQIDPQDMLNIMSFNGMFRIASAVGFQEKDLGKQSIEDLLLKDIDSGAGIELDRDKIVKCLAPIVNIRQGISAQYNAALPKLHERVGEAAAGFEHYYIIGEDEEHLQNRVHVIMTGLSMPDDRLTKVVQRIEEGKKAQAVTKKSSVLASYGDTENFVGNANKAEDAGEIDDILHNF